MQMDTTKDSYHRRCPRLGGPVTFAYCRTCGDPPEPCWKIRDCWWEYFDINTYLEQNLTPAQRDRLAARCRPPAKVASLLELIERARKG